MPLTTNAKTSPASEPRSKDNGYSEDMADARHRFISEKAGVTLQHLSHYSLDPGQAARNIENFNGVALVLMGLACPVRIDGKHAQGDFYCLWYWLVNCPLAPLCWPVTGSAVMMP